MNQLTMYAYPWDIAWNGVETTVSRLRDLGCNRLAMAVAYHSAETIAPARSVRVQVTAEANVAHLALPAQFSESCPRAGPPHDHPPKSGLGPEPQRRSSRPGPDRLDGCHAQLHAGGTAAGLRTPQLLR